MKREMFIKGKGDENKIMKRLASRIYRILIEAGDQQDVLNALWEFDLAKEISTETRKNIWDKRILMCIKGIKDK